MPSALVRAMGEGHWAADYNRWRRTCSRHILTLQRD